MGMNVKFDDGGWGNMLNILRSDLLRGESILKKSLLMVWPKDIASHFDDEMGFDGQWAPWAESTRNSRIAHEIAALGSARKARETQAKNYAQGNPVRSGGKILDIDGKLRTQTIQDPILTWIVGGLRVESPTPYSGYLDEGTPRMPARPFMWLSDDAQETMAQIFLDAIGGNL